MLEAREKIACLACGNGACNHKPLEPAYKNMTSMCPENLEKADAIITLEGENWRIAVVEKESELPKCPYPEIYGEPRCDEIYEREYGYKDAQEDILNEGWMKEVKD